MNTGSQSENLQPAPLSLTNILHLYSINTINPLNAKLNPICHLLALLGAHHILHISRIRVKKRRENFCL